jgi:hypothetical protein
MLTPKDFIPLYKIENDLILKQVADLSQADTLIQPQPSGNCMNWVLGHMLENRIAALTLIGGTSPFDSQELAHYRHGSEPIKGEEAGVLDFSRLVEGLNAVNSAMAQQLEGMDPANFEREVQMFGRTVTLGWRYLFFNHDFSYHMGQLELLRQMAGHTEKIL